MKSPAYVKAYNKIRRAMRRALRRSGPHGGYRAVASQFGVSAGMAYKIITEGYMPSEKSVCVPLGLPYKVAVEVDPITGRVYLPAEIQVIKARIKRRRLEEMTPEELRWRLDHREEVR
jgi:hypothetical protein